MIHLFYFTWFTVNYVNEWLLFILFTSWSENKVDLIENNDFCVEHFGFMLSRSTCLQLLSVLCDQMKAWKVI